MQCFVAYLSFYRPCILKPHVCHRGLSKQLTDKMLLTAILARVTLKYEEETQCCSLPQVQANFKVNAVSPWRWDALMTISLPKTSAPNPMGSADVTDS